MTGPSHESNPYESPSTAMPENLQAKPDVPAGKQVYNVVTDTVGGLNVRKTDNVFQLKVIAVCVLIAAPLGALLGYLYSSPSDRTVGTIMGALGLGFLGVIVGLFGSGVFLMIYRAIRHFRGQHD